jgi:hypothetical protein
MRRLALMLTLTGSAALADTAGPPAPARARITPAQAAMAKYRGDYANAAPPRPCQRPSDGEVVVCAVEGRGGSPERLPLPAERGPRDWARREIGEPPRAGGVGGSPVALATGTGLTLTLKGGKTTLKGNGAK